jgi:hypothetical protein
VKNPPIQEAVNAGAVSALVDMLDVTDSGILFEVCWCLTNIASGSSEHTQAVVDAGAIPKFIKLISLDSPFVVEQSIWALASIFLIRCFKSLLMFVYIAGNSSALRDELLEKGMISQLQPVRLLYCIAFIYCSYY